MNGSLTVQSDGLGQGAAFTLEVPIQSASTVKPLKSKSHPVLS
jgi:hypothetical protein